MRAKLNIALKEQYKDKRKIDVIAIVGDVAILLVDRYIVTVTISKVRIDDKDVVRANGYTQELIDLMNYNQFGGDGLFDDSSEYVLVDGFLYQLDFETSTSIAIDESSQVPSENKIGDVFTLCL
jgi:hypothetical protein